MRHEDERAIEDLFERLRNVERSSAPRDADAEALIARRLAEHPGAAYYMAQTVIVQEAALREAHQRVEELEKQSQPAQGGFLGGIFGGDRPAAQREGQDGPWGRREQVEEDVRQRHPAGGGFLAGAAQTALGVTGGLLLGGAITGLFSGGTEAADTTTDPVAEEPSAATDEDWSGDDFDMGGDF
ncbi:DUF2076 domain-containing protein [Nostoc sp. 3335mG]|nr:DUF2076 domain-containing protein [Nostoc sp. 3335mG]